MKILFIFTLGLFFSLSASSQLLKPIKWSYAAKRTPSTEAIVFIKATIENRRHIYSQTVSEGGPVKTTFNFVPTKSLQTIGETIDPKPITKFENFFNMNISYFANEVVSRQKIKINGKNQMLNRSIEFMICNSKQCLLPEITEFSIPIN